MTHKMPELPYAPGSLAPSMSELTVSIHFGRHLRAYLENTNRLIAGTRYEDMHLKDIVQTAKGAIYNNAAQAWNHMFFFRSLTPVPKPLGETLNQAITLKWGNFENFRKEFSAAATSLFGSGWVWLALDKSSELHILSMPNAGNPMTKDMRPLLCIDVWEHAYYLDFQNRRAGYVEAFWKIVNWQHVEERMTRGDLFLYY